MLEDAKRYVERKIKKIEYIHTKLPEGYEEKQNRYRKMRDELNVLQSVVKGLSNYEFGGTILKHFHHWSNTISNTVNLKALKRDDIYTDTAFVGYELSNTVGDKQLKEVCNDFSKAYECISEDKRKMNEKMGDIFEELSILKKKCKQIDHQRKTVNNLRYDLEEILQSNIYKEDQKENLEKKLGETSEKTLVEMDEFMHLSMINGVIKKIAKTHREFCKKAGDHLEKFS
ncbi:SWP12 [Ecytonucleospora hepatopenaei]|uniref:SWP12 n=6 Tax=Ecytonucleospora hepatopenaei TaxID=646526 RepID=A0A1W0E3P7_9MICR|nr:spore wall protein 1 [Ecytonucleospora hepatopenaei]OQS53864.1 SWP12 [Ecytonucleospora hepatopenaei]